MRSTLTDGDVLSPYLGKDVHPISWMREGSSGEMICPEERDTDENLLHNLRGIQVTWNEPSSLEGGLSQRQGVIDLSHKPRGPNDTTDKQGLPRMRKENLCNFLKAYDQKGKGDLFHIFEERAKNEDEKIRFLSSALGGGRSHKLPQFKPGSDVLFGETSI